MIKVKRLQSIEDLVTEAEIITNGGVADAAMRRSSDGEKFHGADGAQALDRLLDYFINLGDAGIAEKLGDMKSFRRTFGHETTMKFIINEYLNYIKSTIIDLRKLMADELDSKRPNEDTISKLNKQTVECAARLELLERIYGRFKELNEFPELSDRIIEMIADIKNEIVQNYVTPIIKSSERTKQAYSEFEKAETGEEAADAAKKIFDSVNFAKAAADQYPKAVVDGIDQVNDYYEKKIEEVVGKEVADQIKNEVYADKDSLTLLRDIFAYQNGAWSTKKQIVDEAHKLRTRVNDRKLISTDAKVWLVALIDGIEKDLITRLENKQFDTGKYKGIHYDFEKKLPLFEKTPLPVTGKQIADDSKIMKFRKGLQSLVDLIGGAGGPETKEERAWYETGKFVHEVYAKTLNKSAMAIGKLIGGREGEMRADAVSRLFIPQTKVVDKPAQKQVNEDAVAPGAGTSPQVPGAIGGMGAIVAPTRTSIGSGDQFQSTKKKKTKTKKTKNAFIMEFNDFLKNLK